MRTWCPLWNGIVYSSIWDEEDYVLKVFMTMLALKDKFHIVSLTAYQLSKLSRKSETEVLDALKILSSPDTKRKEKQEFNGRRIRAVPEGWLILNGQKYQDQVYLEQIRRKNREGQQAWRNRKKAMAAHAMLGKGEHYHVGEPGSADSESTQNIDTRDYEKPSTEPETQDVYPSDDKTKSG